MGKSTTNPKITVLMPVYNAERYLAEAIDSILNQTFRNFEFLIINDGSRDKSLKIINSYNDSRIRIINHQENKGLVCRLNEGIKLSKAALIARMDADDVSDPSRLEIQYAYKQKHPDIIAFGSFAKLINAKGSQIGLPIKSITCEALDRIMAVNNPFNHSSMLMEKNKIISVGGYKNSVSGAEDYDLWMRCIQIGRMTNIDKYLISYRIHDLSKSNTKSIILDKDTNICKTSHWQKFGKIGPAPKQYWPKIWPKQIKTTQEKLFYFALHIAFCKGYLSRKRYIIAFQHFLGAIKIDPGNYHWFYILMFFMPIKLFEKIERKGSVFLIDRTNKQCSRN